MRSPRTLLAYPADRRKQVRSSLENAGYHVESVERATTAVARLSGGEFDCLISAYDLPGDDGLSLLEAVREIDSRLPVILYSDLDESLTQKAFDRGINRLVHRNGATSLEQLVDEVAEVTSPFTEPPQDVSEYEPDPKEIVRAINEAPIGVSLSHANLPDAPLVYINDAWEDVTGYEREHVLGRNPRFLQGPETDSQTTESIAKAIENDAPITVEMRNYRRDGTPFWNELTVAPVRDDDGDVVHYVGFQNDVTDRKVAELVAEERAQKLTEERRALRRVLDRIHGLLNDVIRILVTERNQRIIAHRVCDEIVDTDGYGACWMGSTTPAGERFEIEASAGVSDGTQDRYALEALPDAVSETLETDELATCTVGGCNGDVLSPATVGARRLATVPIRYGQKRYGILGVYGEGNDALDNRDQQLFASVGRMIASRLNAIETQKILTADHVIEVEVAVQDETFPLSKVAAKLDGDVEFVGLTHDAESANGTCEWFLTTDSTESLSVLPPLPFVEDVRPLTETGAGKTFALTVDSSTPFDDVAEYGAVLTDLVASVDNATLELELPPSYDVRSILDVLEELYDGVALRSRRKREQRVQTPLEQATALEEELTDRQQAALEAAHMNGYFEWPRPTDGSEIAETMGITRQTFHQHLRAAEGKLVETYLGALDNGIDP